MPDRQLGWDEVREVLIKRRKAGQAPHWSIGWVAARVARNENKIINKSYKHVVLDYYQAHATGDEDAVKTRTWHRLVGFVDGLHNAGIGQADGTLPASQDDATQIMEEPGSLAAGL